jgi:hypothetical protein
MGKTIEKVFLTGNLKGKQIMRKIIKTTLFSTIVMAVLCAGSVSARQLQTKPKLFPTCTGTCSATKPCFGGCICQNFGGSISACVRDPGPAKPIGH